jgi:hydroxymethylpyrimidine/phosphomethylpyrimidine kinase
VTRSGLTSLSAMSEPRIPRVLSIAGSDSGGGAGIQADLKAFAAAGVHGMTAITAITAQNTVGVTAVHHIPAEIIEAQVTAVADDIGIDAVKIGMLGRTETIQAVARALARLNPGVPVVLDPVMVSESGATLLEEEARAAMIELLFPRATVVTPNLPEARALCMPGDDRNREDDAPTLETEGETEDRDGALRLVRAVQALGPRAAVLTGGHRAVIADLFYDGTELVELRGERHAGGAAHGSGCTHSSVLAARLARGDTPLVAARAAQRAAAGAVARGLTEIGAGPGPVDVLDIRLSRFSG